MDRHYFVARIGGEGTQRTISLQACAPLAPCPPSLVYGFPLRDCVCVVVFPGWSHLALDRVEDNESFHRTLENMLAKALDRMGVGVKTARRNARK